ncbi:hypothetical protein EB796_006972 [Bugula neritina]|uniref:Tyrosine-protein phosphatase domain-containing protein n=1 Tax=Bugula neritina TaxID=10212 RepID=A0A7J7K900_BUGNE|nr:hypothetical protein EB796_006972 [Bugula neritina]
MSEMKQPTAGELKAMKSSMGLDDLEEIKRKKRNSAGPLKRGAESYQTLADIPANLQKSIKEDKEKQIATALASSSPPSSQPAYGALANLYTGKDINQLVDKCKVKGRTGLIDEYYDLKASEPAMDFRTSRMPKNMSKNRYADVLCLDVSRVILKGESYESDYINANYVDGFDHKKAYISTQGPLEHTVKDQWRLIFQENVRVIVMTTKLAERGRIKCDAYWPLEPLETVDYGKIKVVNLGIANKGDYQITLLEATHKEKDEALSFLSWPDYGVPPDANGFLKFLFHVRKAQHEFTKGINWKFHPRGPLLWYIAVLASGEQELLLLWTYQCTCLTLQLKLTSSK